MTIDGSGKCVFLDSKFDDGDDDESISGRHFEKLHHEVRIILQLQPEKFLKIIGRSMSHTNMAKVDDVHSNSTQ